ncbi:MAG: glycosyltransferase family 2 protein [Candidatus Krumholzibacteriia bacterium]
MKISAAILSHEAADDLDRCLASLAFVDDVVVLLHGTTDHTRAVCARHGARVHQTRWEGGFGPMKQRVVDLCRHDWVLSIDSDEEITPELRAAILALPDQPPEAAFELNRLSRFLGRWIRHCGWHPDWVVRLFDRRRGRFDGKPVHEGIHVDGPVGRLDGLMLHYTYETMEQYITKLNSYTSLAAHEQVERGRGSTLPRAVLRSQATFWRMWLLKRGFRDGWEGTVLCLASSFYVLAKYTKLWRMEPR